MPNPSSFSEHGFFSEEAEEQSKLFRDGNIQYFTLYRRIANLGYQTIKELRNSASDIRKGITTCLTIRALSCYDGIRLCVEKGMEFEARVLLRSQLEATYTVLACEKDKHFHEHFIKAATKEKHKLLTRLLDSNLPTSNTKADLKTRAAHLKKKITENPIKTLSTKEIAIKAGMEKSYNLVYSFYSSTVHVNPLSLQEYIVFDENVGIKEIIWGPQHERSVGSLLSSMHTMILCLLGATSIFGVDCENSIGDMRAQWDKLNSKAKKKMAKRKA